jgi:hypothetical protein
MTTTSSNLTAGTAITAQGSNGKISKGRAAGLVAIAALGLSLLAGMALSQARPVGQPMAPAGDRVNPYWAYTEDVTLPSDYPALIQSARVNPYWVYAEDVILNANPATAAFSDPAPAFVPGQFTYREDHRGER